MTIKERKARARRKKALTASKKKLKAALKSRALKQLAKTEPAMIEQMQNTIAKIDEELKKMKPQRKNPVENTNETGNAISTQEGA